MDGTTLFDKLLALRGVNPNSLAAAINRPGAQSGFDRFRKGLIRQPKRGEPLELAAKHLGVNVLAFYDEALAEQEWARVSGAAPTPSTSTPALSSNPGPGEPTVTVPVLANAGSMGGGIEALHDDVVIGALTLSENWVVKYVRPTRIAALRFIHGFGDSMSPTFEDGDILLVDTGVRDPQAIDGVYVLSANSRLYIKRVRCRLDGATEVSSDNPTVKTVDVLDGGTNLDVLGRVVWCWNGRKL